MRVRIYAIGALVCCMLFACGSEPEEPAPAEFINPTWIVQPTGTSARLQAIYAVDEQIVWASGISGTYVRTTDGGTTWTAGVVPGADTLQFRDLHAVDANTAYLLSSGTGDQSRIYKTTDGGASWDLQFTNSEPTGFFSCMGFWDADTGMAMSDSIEGEFILIKTTDGGTTWTRIPPESVPDAHPGEGAFAASGTCLVTLPGGHAWIGTGASSIESRVLRTSDYGETWSIAVTPLTSNTPTAGAFSMAFQDTQNGAAFGGDYLLADSLTTQVAVTTDGGATWNLTGSPALTGSIFGGTFVPGTPSPTMVVVSPGGSAYSTDNGRTWSRIDSVDYWSVTFLSPETGWAVGPAGRIAKINLGTH